jgi:hypothetical protein
MALEVINPILPETIGGSADLTGSNNTKTADLGIFEPENRKGRYVHYGIREHGMAAAMNGMALHGGVRPYGGTFMCFADYARPAMRLSALMGLPVQYVMTHDSIGLGEDGPTHQPVEHLAMLRATPNMLVFRPADAVETAEAWEIALSQTATPSVLALSRQGLPTVRTEHKTKNLTAQGAYVLAEAEGKRQALLMATGSEVAIAHGRARPVAGRGDRHARRLHALLGALRGTGRGLSPPRPARRARCAWRSRPRSASAGTAGSTASGASARNRASSACTASAARPRRAISTRISASPPRRSRDCLRKVAKSLKKGGAQQLAVRRITDADFARIVDMGLPQDLMSIEERRYSPTTHEMDDEAAPFTRPVTERLTRRAYRDVAFRRKVREAYGYRCAMSGLMLRNGGGRPEVQAAHIRPVAQQGSDAIRNGLALSGTLHWMFDRGLISVAEDCRTILVSHNKVPSDVVTRLLPPDVKLIAPLHPHHAPHPENLRWHRENIFGRAAEDTATPWS